MYRLLIVDDDPWVRRWLMEHINWEELGFVTVREAVNGCKAMKLIEEEQPHVVITDIKMDEMDGIELLAKVRDRYSDVRMILLSGYDEFEYARAAIKKGAVDYLLKPIEENELVAIIKRTLAEIEQESTGREHQKKISEQLEQSIQLLQANFVKELLAGDLSDPADLKDRFSIRNINIDFSSFYVLVLEIDNQTRLAGTLNPDKAKALKKHIKDNVEKQLAKTGKVICFFENDLLVIGYSPASFDFEKDIGLIREEIHRDQEVTVSVGISRLKESPALAREAYLEAYKALRSKFYFGRNQTLFYKEEEPEGGNVFFEIGQKQQLLNALEIGNSEKASELLGDLFRTIRERKISYETLNIIHLRLLDILYQSLERAGFSQDALFASGSETGEGLEKFETLDDLENWFLYLFSREIDVIHGKGSRRNRKIIEDAINHIHENISEEFSLDMVAKKLYVNPAYLSRLFKEEVGKTFTHFSMKVRVEKAKELLKDSYLKVYEISEKVGYKNDKYFSRIFKDFEGITPNEYRDRIIKQKVNKLK